MDAVAAQQRTMKDFLELYNKMVFHCFDKCVSNFNHATASDEETRCVNACADKCINFNQRHMMVFMEYQSTKQKLAVKTAAENQTPKPAAPTLQTPGATTGPDISTNTGLESSTLTPGATALSEAKEASAEGATPQNVCWRPNSKVFPHLTMSQTDISNNYNAKYVVDQFLNSRSDSDTLKTV